MFLLVQKLNTLLVMAGLCSAVLVLVVFILSLLQTKGTAYPGTYTGYDDSYNQEQFEKVCWGKC